MRWLRRIFSRTSLGMDDDERQNLTTLSMMGGAMVMTGLISVMVWIIRWSWPDELLADLAPAILDHLAWITFGAMGLMAVMIIAQATIAVGGRFKAKLGPAEFAGETEDAVPEQRRRDHDHGYGGDWDRDRGYDPDRDGYG